MQSTIIDDCEFYYDNLKSIQRIYDDVFKKDYYSLSTIINNISTKKPFIIDCGANVGITTLYFKKFFPQAKMICFEPNPHAFEALTKNITLHNCSNITLVKAAVSNRKGQSKLYGDILNDNSDARSDSLLSTWGKKNTNNYIEVNTVKLSSYIDSKVDLLKMNIEGAEQLVLEELNEKLKFVKQILVEVHESNNSYSANSYHTIENLLKNRNFKLEVKHINLSQYITNDLQSWYQTEEPRLIHCRGFNQDYIR